MNARMRSLNSGLAPYLRELPKLHDLQRRVPEDIASIEKSSYEDGK